MPSRPAVYLCYPHYGDVALASLYAALQPSLARGENFDEIIFQDHGISILPHGFNLGLAAALNLRDAGRITHFAMLHSDVCPAPGWLDTLWDEMRRTGCDLISAVVPIKEMTPDPPTSTAIGRRDDPWAEPAKLRMSRRRETGETFGREIHRDNEVLLVNTGCFLADLRRPWWDDFAFEFRTRLAKRPEGYVAEVIPEDWQMSRTLSAAGADLRATWKIPLCHKGQADWWVPPPADARAARPNP